MRRKEIRGGGGGRDTEEKERNKLFGTDERIDV